MPKYVKGIGGYAKGRHKKHSWQLQWEWLYEQQEVNNQEVLLVGLGIHV